MNLDDWLALTPAQRNAEREAWGRAEMAALDPIDRNYDRREPWSALLREATARFDQEYRQHPLINRIDCGVARILVTIALYPPQFLEEIPSHYCGFLVEQDPINANRDCYLRHWRILFSELLGWSDVRINEWSQQWDDDLNGRTNNPWLYHEDEYSYAIPAIVCESGATLEFPRHPTYAAIEDAIRHKASSPIWLSPIDWDAVRARVNDILEPFGGRLPK